MTTESVAILVGALAVVEGLVILVLFATRRRMRNAPAPPAAGADANRVGSAAAIDSRLVGSPSTDAPIADAHPEAPTMAAASTPNVAGQEAGPAPAGTAATAADHPTWSAVRRDASGPDTAADLLVDRLTGLDSALVWEQTIRDEGRRFARYGRPVALVVAELTGIERVGEQLGQDVADRVIAAVADTLRRNARCSDRIARIGPARFALLLPETDEILAINYVERVRAASDRWLEASAVSLRLSAGWSNPTPGGDLAATFRLAVERLYADRTPGEPAPARRRTDVMTP